MVCGRWRSVGAGAHTARAAAPRGLGAPPHGYPLFACAHPALHTGTQRTHRRAVQAGTPLTRALRSHPPPEKTAHAHTNHTRNFATPRASGTLTLPVCVGGAAHTGPPRPSSLSFEAGELEGGGGALHSTQQAFTLWTAACLRPLGRGPPKGRRAPGFPSAGVARPGIRLHRVSPSYGIGSAGKKQRTRTDWRRTPAATTAAPCSRAPPPSPHATTINTQRVCV